MGIEVFGESAKMQKLEKCLVAADFALMLLSFVLLAMLFGGG